ncbi:hypothetical protein ACP275_08G097500 [Erythranthe tilingii]
MCGLTAFMDRDPGYVWNPRPNAYRIHLLNNPGPLADKPPRLAKVRVAPVIECCTVKGWKTNLKYAIKSGKLVVIDFTSRYVASCCVIDPILRLRRRTQTVLYSSGWIFTTLRYYDTLANFEIFFEIKNQ